MTKVSIIEQGINNLNSIRKKLEERDAIVSIVKNYNDLNNLDTNTLLIAKELVGSNDEKILNLARNHKIKKLFLLIIQKSLVL